MDSGASDIERRFMRLAIRLAAESVHSGCGGPFAAIVVRGAELVATGTNQVTADSDPTAHAEIVAIRRACRVIGSFQLTGCDLYANCEPCPMCMGAIYWARVSRVYYASIAADAAKIGFDDELIAVELRRPAGARRIPMLQMMREESLSALQAWQRKKDRVPY